MGGGGGSRGLEPYQKESLEQRAKESLKKAESEKKSNVFIRAC